MKLFEKFDKTYCLNLKKRKDRLEHFEQQVKKYDLGIYQYFEAIDGSTLDNPYQNLKSGEFGHILSTISILEDAILKNYKNILLVEDDCVFLNTLKEIDLYFEKLPKDWDLLYFGGNHNTHMKVNPPVKINERVVKLHSTYSSHCLSITKKMFPIILEELKKFSCQTDLVYQKLQTKYNVYCFYPTIASQLTGHSDIQNKVVDYSWIIK